MTTDEELKTLLLAGIRSGDNALSAILRWVEVISVDADEKTMDAKGVSDGLEYFNIELGAGSVILYPTVGTLCLIGMVEGLETSCFLVSATEVDKVEVTSSTEIILNGGTLGGLVKVQELTDRLNLIEKDINSLKQKLSGWTPAPNDGGAALKTALSSYFSKSLQETQVADIENEKVKQ